MDEVKEEVQTDSTQEDIPQTPYLQEDSQQEAEGSNPEQVDEGADTEGEEEPKKEETPLKVFKVGDLNFKCHACGHTYVIEEGVQGGIRFDLYTTNKHKLALACPQCKAVLEMYFTEGDSGSVVDIDGNPIKSGSGTNPEEKTVKEDIQEVTQEEADEMVESEEAVPGPEVDTPEEEKYQTLDSEISDDNFNPEPVEEAEEDIPEFEKEEIDLPEDVVESIETENKERENEISVQEENK